MAAPQSIRVKIAEIGDLWWHLRIKNWSCPGIDYRLMVAEVMARRVWAVGETGAQAAIAIGGVFQPAPDAPGVCWLSVTPGGLGPRSLVMIRSGQKLVAHVAREHPNGVNCHVRVDNAKGERLARALGFRPGTRRVGALRIWSWRGCEWATS